MSTGQVASGPRRIWAANRCFEEFETRDFYLACFLRCLGFSLTDIRREGRRCIFLFQDKPERRDIMMAFYNNEGTVQPLAFVGTIKDMKALIHNI